eukprot:XP_001690295.1 predicted protein [Chlamydomonas reinhardtii]
MDNREHQREQLRAALQARGADLTCIGNVVLDSLWDNGYSNARALQEATREGLKAAGLKPALIDQILTLEGTVEAFEQQLKMKVAEATRAIRLEAVKMTAAAAAAMTKMTQQVVTQGMGLAKTVTVTASHCSSNQRKQIEHMVTSQFSYHSCCTAPCCLKDPFPSVSVSEGMDWSRFGNQERNATEWGRDWLEKNLAPPGVVVLVASDARWLDCMVEFPGGRVKIGPSATDYIFVRKEAWEKCWENQGAESHMEAAAGSGTGMACSLSKEAVLSLAGSILALYEAKTDAGLRKLGSVRGQALLQYLAINYMKNWPARDVIVIYGDFNDNYTIHAGRQDSGARMWSLHVAGPPSAVPEHGLGFAAASSSGSSSPCSVNAGFIRALMSTPRTVETSARAAGEAAGAGGAGGGGGAAGPGGGGGGGRLGDIGGSGDSTPAVSSSGGGGRSGSSSGEDEGGFDGDEGLLEAAGDNYFAQAFMSVLRRPEVYRGVLQQDAPPTAFQPPTREELLDGFADVLVKARLQQLADERRL